jgi:CHAT domain-containing protein
MAVSLQLMGLCRSGIAIILAANLFAAAAQMPDDSRDAKIAAAFKVFEEASALGAKGDKDSIQAAVKKLESIEPVFEKYNDQMKLAGTLVIHGGYLISVGPPDTALRLMNRGLEIYRSINYPPGQATALLAIGSFYYKQNDFEHARGSLEEARAHIEKQPLNSFDLPIYQALGNVYIALKDRKKATEVLWKAYQVAKDRTPEEAINTLINYADAQIKLETPKFAVGYYEIALKRAQFDKLPKLEVRILNSLAETHFKLDQGGTSKTYLDQALKRLEDLNDDSLRSKILKNLGYFSYITIRMQEALGFYERARLLTEKLNDRSSMAVIAYETGLVYQFLDDQKRAFSYFKQAITLARETNNKLTELFALGGLARSQIKLEDIGVIETYTAALALGNELSTVNTGRVREFALDLMNNMGNFMLSANQRDTALMIFSKALDGARQGEYRSAEATFLNNLAKIYELNGDNKKALEYYNSSLVLSRSLGSKYGEATTLGNIMGAWAKLGNNNFATFYGKSSVNILQDFRSGISGLSIEERRSYLKTIEGVYRQLVSLLIAQGRIAEAEQVLTMLKEEELIDYVRRDDTVAKELLGKMSISDEERAAIQRYDALAGQITAVGKEFSDLDDERKQFPAGEFPKQAKYDKLKQELADASTAFEKFLEGLKTKFGQTDARVALVDSGLKKTLDRLKAKHTIAVSTIVGKDTLNLIVTTSKTQRAHTVKVSEDEVNTLVAKFRTALTSPQYDPRPVGQQLYDLVVKPIEADLAGIKADTILWSLDGTLRYIPPAALWDKTNGYLAERFSNVMVNLASRDSLSLPTASGQKLSVLGVGVSKPTDGFAPLTAVPEELDCIVADISVGMLSARPQCANGVLAGRKLLDEKFTLTNFEGELGRYPIVHIASHFKLTPGDDKNSFLLLGGGEDRKFTVEKLRAEPLTDIELIVLSACNTATPGGARANGVEVEGFASIAQKEGAKSVLATLWSVADTSTKDFMVEFYRHYGKEGLSKASAMRRAQLKLMYGKYSADEAQKHRADDFVQATDKTLPPFKADPNAPFAHPFYWSPFTLTGNWQ